MAQLSFCITRGIIGEHRRKTSSYSTIIGSLHQFSLLESHSTTVSTQAKCYSASQWVEVSSFGIASLTSAVLSSIEKRWSRGIARVNFKYSRWSISGKWTDNHKDTDWYPSRIVPYILRLSLRVLRTTIECVKRLSRSFNQIYLAGIPQILFTKLSNKVWLRQGVLHCVR